MQKTVELQRPARTATRTEWTSRVIPWSSDVWIDETTGVKHPVFEDLLNSAFEELANSGFHVTTVQQYPAGFVVLANRVTSGHAAVSRLLPSTTSEVSVVYTWRANGKPRSKTFSSMEEALRLISRHFKDNMSLPLAVHQSVLTSYNCAELQLLVESI